MAVIARLPSILLGKVENFLVFGIGRALSQMTFAFAS
jgi:hypothetical protein